MEQQLDIDISNRRVKMLVQEIRDSVDSARTAFMDGEVQKANAFFAAADVLSRMLIAERIDLLGKIILATAK